jgi:hypothetical protein
VDDIPHAERTQTMTVTKRNTKRLNISLTSYLNDAPHGGHGLAPRERRPSDSRSGVRSCAAASSCSHTKWSLVCGAHPHESVSEPAHLSRGTLPYEALRGLTRPSQGRRSPSRAIAHVPA